MKSITVYHNPSCSKSRSVVAILERYNIIPTLFFYMNGSLTIKHLKKLMLQTNLSIGELVRKTEPVYTTYNLDNIARNDDSILEVVVKNPILLQRPIVVYNNHAIVARPPETIISFLNLT